MRDRADLAGGLVLAVLGAAVAAYAALHYDIGTLRRMGPGFFPLGLGALLAVLGGSIAFGAAPAQSDKSRIALPELAAILTAILVFALGLERLGLVLTTALTVLIASAAAPRAGLLWRVALAVIITAISVVIFKLALAMTLPLWPS